jgi:hypothetical protein
MSHQAHVPLSPMRQWRRQHVGSGGSAVAKRLQQRGGGGGSAVAVAAAAAVASALRRRPAWRQRRKIGLNAALAVAAQSTIN